MVSLNCTKTLFCAGQSVKEFAVKDETNLVSLLRVAGLIKVTDTGVIFIFRG